MSKEYSVVSYDGFASPDERSDMLRGEFDNEKDAIDFAKGLIDADIEDAIRRGKNLEEAIDEFKNFSEIPYVLGSRKSKFSPYDYVNGLLGKR